MKIYLSLGSNLGDRENLLRKARMLLEETGVRIAKTSKIYETEPVGKKGQPMFFNQCIEAQTDLSPRELLGICQKIENELGRERGKEKNEKWGPRTIDIDILFYGDQIVTKPDLKIPHPLLHERRFVLVPLAEIAPDMFHPIINLTITNLLQRCSDKSIVTPKE